jgi:hypothetical protein
VVTVETHSGVGPVTTDCVTAEDGQPEVREKGNCRFKIAHGDADVLEFDGHVLHATASRQCDFVGELYVPARLPQKRSAAP